MSIEEKVKYIARLSAAIRQNGTATTYDGVQVHISSREGRIVVDTGAGVTLEADTLEGIIDKAVLELQDRLVCIIERGQKRVDELRAILCCKDAVSGGSPT